ncbi:hypothetical protein EVAR_91886_1 [Eumeta japonica]|uniref:Uncharacterized protein n=1 Tax=Eumeta variegata TaxID=151549 RepID=A0A4C1TP21_EUMVA|nr:hypothetical protein EVAR_91886_1 [Eumeta japonica]
MSVFDPIGFCGTHETWRDRNDWDRIELRKNGQEWNGTGMEWKAYGKSYSSRRHKRQFLATNFDVSKRRTDAQKSKLRNMCVELDQDDVMRATKRLDRHQSSTQSKRPVILTRKIVSPELLIQNAHQKWHCIQASMVQRTIDDAKTGELPAERLKAHEPFNCSAIDYFGLMIVTVGRRTEKRWGAITCLTTRAVHLEIAASLTPSSAILAPVASWRDEARRP